MLSPLFWITTGIAIYGCVALGVIALGKAARRADQDHDDAIRLRMRRQVFGVAHHITPEMFDFNGEITLFCDHGMHDQCHEAGARVSTGGFIDTPCLCDCHSIADFARGGGELIDDLTENEQ